MDYSMAGFVQRLRSAWPGVMARMDAPDPVCGAEVQPPTDREAYVSRAFDAPELERRERAWERDLSNAYRMPG